MKREAAVVALTVLPSTSRTKMKKRPGRNGSDATVPLTVDTPSVGTGLATMVAFLVTSTSPSSAPTRPAYVK
jgi:hypothetical protein